MLAVCKKILVIHNILCSFVKHLLRTRTNKHGVSVVSGTVDTGYLEGP